MTTSVVILAAGRGDRMQSSAHKILLRVCGKALICHTVSAFAQVPELDELIVVVHRDDMDNVRRLVQPIADHCRFVEGGGTRRDSSLRGVRAATGDFVLIHDGARPFPSAKLIRDVLLSTQRERAAIPVLPVADLLHPVDKTSDRISNDAPVSCEHSLARAQTPQGFRRDLILRCLEAAPPEIGDDATAVLLAGESVATVPGEPTNLKITHPEDLALAEAIAASRT